ncbi:MAG TPA: hypothetical protein PKE31_19830 [Pseudomonadota bacterium]|nr:hypothetical protein [Pseudomonadota bacterium]
MAATKSGLDIGALFEHELEARKEDLRRQTALLMFSKLRPGNRVTVEQFLDSLKQHADVWAAVSGMGILDFAQALAESKPESVPKRDAKPAKIKRRTRLSDAQKLALKGVVLDVLSGHADGMSRAEIASQPNEEVLGRVGVRRDQLADKLRQPLLELVKENKLHTVGEKRLMKYIAGPKPAAKS